MNTDKPACAWQCDECLTVHDDEDEAYECCRPQVIEGHLCPICDGFHQLKQDAIDCCDFNPDDFPPRPHAFELEAAGQERLFP
ncbi:MAG: hypothetical protein KKF85_03535 [Gammaproteobacteria bacterium]|nr:hypothetical protein [Rhodocyclaceae bacterium]MBU3908895.1 hypothetical protein [Gammaproteobacteria bacterium]MBU3987762.1 hypothetical protein [Gammaproteobacteria bacterium]MBU4003373.1 hypothetical protein [Gammaproteobacteria bacterium]MBU4021844.1 hypothetical protein [Gammaproteobacteria bacterium]